MKFTTVLSKIALILLIVSSIFTENAHAQWAQTNGPLGGYSQTFAVSGSNIFAGKYRSTNNGASWTPMNMNIISGYYTFDMAAMGTELYVVNTYAYRSTNYGASWIDISAGLTQGAYSIASYNNTLYAGSLGTVYISTNNGANWTASTNNLPSTNINRIFASAGNILITSANKIYRSTNNGANWNAVAGMQTRNIYNFTSVGSNYFACGDSGVYISTNSGANWQKVNTGLPVLESAYSITSNGNALFVGYQGSGVFRSTNNGASWTPANNGLSALRISGLISLGTDVFCQNGNGMYRSTDSGLTWLDANTGMASKDISYIASIGNNIFAGSESSGNVFRSSNEGVTWQNISAGLGTATIYGLVARGTNLFTSVSQNPGDTTQGIFKSTNNGANWIKVYSTYASTMGASTDKIYAGLYNGMVASTDDGASWVPVSVPNPNFGIRKLAVSGNLIIASNSSNYHVSTNAGANWTTAPFPNTAFFYDFSITGSNIYAVAQGAGNGIYKSSNNGLNWTKLITPGNFPFACLEYNNDIFIGMDSGVYRSTNGGANWIRRSQGLEVNASYYYSSTVLKFFPFNNNMYAGTLYSSVIKAPLSYLTGVQNISTEVPDKFLLQQNYPNPFNPSTKINFLLPANSFVKLTVYNSIGKEVSNLVNEKLSAGSYAFDFSGEMLTSGVYYYKLETENFSETKKMVLVK